MITSFAATVQMVSIEREMARGATGEYSTIKPVGVGAGRLASRGTVCSGTGG